MKTISSFLLAGTVLLAAVSCTSPEFKKTKSGLLYKIMTDGKGNTVKKGEFLKVNVVQKVRDSILYTTYGSMPFYMHVDSVGPIYSHMEVMPMLRKGDSAVIVMLVDSLQRKFGGPLPAYIKKKDKITFVFKVLDIFASDDLLAADKDKEMEKEKAREISDVEKYLADNKIQTEKTAAGTYVLVKDPGNGPQVDSGKEVSVRYTAKTLPNGKVFESNMNPPAEPLKFVIGTHAVIQGWDDGLRKFKKGGKGTLYIPSYLGYGGNPAGPGHKPFEDMMFDVEVVDVTDAPKPAAGPNMPPPQMNPQARPGQPTHR
jgi:FKBP-type peptidyl-prolyl cis-trans isomerase